MSQTIVWNLPQVLRELVKQYNFRAIVIELSKIRREMKQRAKKKD
jgi:hypothetical protein